MTLDGRVALIGSDGGPFGRAVAVALAEAGADVALATMSGDDASVFAVNSIANELWALGRRHLTLSLSGENAASAMEAVARTCAELGGLDLLVTLAETAPAEPFTETPESDGPQTAKIGLHDLLVLCRAAGAAMLDLQGGVILNAVRTDPQAATASEPDASGVAGMSRALAREWSRRIAVNAALLREQTEPAVLGSLAVSLASSPRTGALVSGQVFEL